MDTAIAMNSTDRTITVTGRATVKAKADVTRIRMEINGTDMEYEGAIRKCAENHRDMRDRLESVGLDRDGLRTVSQRVEPHYEEVSYEGRDGTRRTKRVRQGFEYEDVLSFEFPTDNETLGRMLTVMLRAPCQPDVRMSFVSSDPEGSRKEALRLAAEDAREKAGILASALGCGLDCVVDVSYESSSGRDYRGMEDMCLCSSMAMDNGIETDIDPQDVSFTEAVEVVWKIR